MSTLSADLVGQLLDRLPIGGVLLRDNRVIHGNRAAHTIFGRESLIDQSFSDLLSDEAPHLVAARLTAACAGHPVSRRLPSVLRRPDGAEIAVDLAIAPLDEAAMPTLVVLIHESRWLERRDSLLRTFEGHLRALVDASPALILVQDLQARILFANRCALEFTGRALDEVRGTSLLSFIPEREHATVIERAATRLQGSIEPYTYQATLLSGSGEEIALDVLSMPLLHEEIAVAVLVIARPTRGALGLAEALALTRERDAAQEESRRKSDAVAKLSHEMRTPIHLIIGMAEMLADESLSGTQHEIVQRLLQLSQRVGELISKVLDLSSIEAGRLALFVRPFSLRSTVESALAPLRALASTRDLDLTIHTDDEVPDPLLGDPGRLQQILSNLVDNAIRNTIQGRVRATIQLASTPTKDSVHLLFAVHDTGVGIPLELRTAIFDAFVQGPPPAGEAAAGIGLGLAIARELAILLGGRIWLESEVGVGSIFYFTASFAIAGASR